MVFGFCFLFHSMINEQNVSESSEFVVFVVVAIFYYYCFSSIFLFRSFVFLCIECAVNILCWCPFDSISFILRISGTMKTEQRTPNASMNSWTIQWTKHAIILCLTHQTICSFYIFFFSFGFFISDVYFWTFIWFPFLF